MELLRYAPSLYTLIQTDSGQFFLLCFAYAIMGIYIYKMFNKINSIQKDMEKYKNQTDDNIKKVFEELKQVSRVVYKMAGKLEID
jgi:hypothetical protein